jgi:hypothetical protein
MTIGGKSFAVVNIKYGSGLDDAGNIADDTLVALWRQQIGVCLNASISTGKANLGHYDHPRVLIDTEGYPINKTGERIADRGGEVATVRDGLSPEQQLEHYRNQAADWVDQISQAITILKRTKLRAKIKGECPALDVKTWGEVEAEASQHIEFRFESYKFENGLSAVADLWADVVTTDLGDRSPLFGKPKPEVFGYRIASFIRACLLAGRLWNDSKDQLWGKYRGTLVCSAMEQFSAIRQLIEDGPISDLFLVSNAYVTEPIALEIKRLLDLDMESNGIDAKPFKVVEYARELDQFLFAPATTDSLNRPQEAREDSLKQRADDFDSIDVTKLKLTKAERRDFSAYLAGCKASGLKTTKEVYDFLHGEPELGVKLSTFETNVSRAKKLAGVPEYNKRGGREHGKSIQEADRV